jgi:hypothetical protein
MKLFLRTDNENHRKYFLSGTSSLLELYRQYVLVQIEVYFNKCYSMLPSASGCTSCRCVVIYRGNIILKVQRNFGKLLKISENVRCLQRRVTCATAHNDSLLMKTIRNKGVSNIQSGPRKRIHFDMKNITL